MERKKKKRVRWAHSPTREERKKKKRRKKKDWKTPPTQAWHLCKNKNNLLSAECSMTPITPALIKTLDAFTDCAVMRGAQWIGMHANCHQENMRRALQFLWHGTAPWPSACQKGRGGKTKINEQRWIAVMPCQQYHTFHYRGRRRLRVNAVPKERGGWRKFRFFFFFPFSLPSRLPFPKQAEESR